MICEKYKAKRKRDGKTVIARLWRGRLRLDGETTIEDFGLKTSDKQEAEKRLNEHRIRRERERAGFILPKAVMERTTSR